MNIRPIISETINENLKIRFFGQDINWYNVEVNINWFLNIYHDDLLKNSDGKRLIKVFDCIHNILFSLNMFIDTSELYSSTEEITLSILYSFMDLEPVFHKEDQVIIYI